MEDVSNSPALSDVEATLAHGDLIDRPLELWPYGSLDQRSWQLRSTLTSYDAAYVALAELLEAPLIT